MSRLLVTNLPLKISQEDIKKHFSQKGNVTDVKLIYKNGKFRRFGFIGFEKQEDAQDACRYFNSTYLKQAKITVEICQDFRDGAKPLSWGEKNKLHKNVAKEKQNDIINKEDGKIRKKKKKSEGSGDLTSLYERDPNFKEFMNVSRKGPDNEEHDKQIRSADVGIDAEVEEEKDVVEDAETKIADKKEVSDIDYLKSLMVPSKYGDTADSSNEKKIILQGLDEQFQVVIRTKERCKIRQKGSVGFTKRSVKDFLKPLKWKSLRIPRKTKYVAYVGFKTERDFKRALQKHKSFLNGARVQVIEYQKPADEDKISNNNNTPWSAAEEKLKKLEPVAETGRLYVRNLWYSVTEDDLQELFGHYGKVSEITLPICKLTRRPKGFATVMFMFPENAVRAMSELDGTSFKGRVLHVLPAHGDDENKEKEGESFKEKKAREQKATAGSWHNWNTLFFGSGAVIDVMAEKYNRSKQEILSAEGKQSVAVNLALGETQIVDETKRFMEENGIALDAFTNPGVQRSSTVMLVKNLPANTTAQELFQIFSRYGELGRVVLPPAGITGVVEYLNAGEAKKGFRSLAYSKFHHLPLYLEWAPLKVFKSEYVPKTVVQENLEVITSQGVAANSNHEDIDRSGKESEKAPQLLPDPEPNTTVYVKNLNFTTTEEALKQHFDTLVPVHTVLISKRRGLSQGYGFVQFVTEAHAQKALREMQDTLLDEKRLQLKLSEKTLLTQVKSTRMMHNTGKQTSTKILVKNVPFQATRKEVRQLFATFGELKTVRLPSKPGTQDHRGFGFIDFVTREEAKKAFEALCHSTHLYGRRLVLEWAKDDETIEELREKTAHKFLTGGPPLKKKKISDSLNSKMSLEDE